MKLPQVPPPADLQPFLENQDKLLQIIRHGSPLVNGEYAPWDKVRHLQPPEGLTSREWWIGIRLARDRLLKRIPLLDRSEKPFAYGIPDTVFRLLHEVDQRASGRIQMLEKVANSASRNRYLVSSLIEESITSSQLEGASTTVEVARNMLRSGRPPIDRSEQMILNNFKALTFIRENRDEALTADNIFQLHRILMDETLDDPSKAGVFRRDADPILVEDEIGTVLHIPPKASELPDRLQGMLEFANDRSDDAFVHPVIRSIVLHFWLGHDHPFVDGNGRTARALFYWSMLNQGYWLTEYLTISNILKKAPSQYAASFLHTEGDSNDLTYFLEYHLGVTRRAIDELEKYLARKIGEVRRVDALLKQSSGLNHRQVALLTHALRHPGMRYTIESHRRSHKVAYQTARNDLLDLVARTLLSQTKRGRSFHFMAPSDLEQRMRADDG